MNVRDWNIKIDDKPISSLNEVLECTSTLPIIVIGVDINVFSNSTIIESNISIRELYQEFYEENVHTPPLMKQIIDKSTQSDITHLIIKDLDNISIEKQENFLTLIKDGKYILPKNVKIIITATEIEKLSKEIFRFVIACWSEQLGKLLPLYS